MASAEGLEQPRLLARLGGWRWGWLAGYVADGAVAVALAVAALATLTYADEGAGSRDPDVLAYVLAGVLTLPLVVRRRWPMEVFGVILVAMAVFEGRNYNGDNVDFFGPVLAFYTVAAHESRVRSVAAGVAVSAVVLVSSALWATSEDWVQLVLTTAVIVIGVWLLGDAARQKRVYGERLAAQAESLRAARLELAEQAVIEERLRIARELHDVVAHHMGVVVVQAEVAREQQVANPDAARRALDEVLDTARAALRELRAMLGVMRGREDGGAGLDPAPGMRELDELYQRVREGGVEVDVVTVGTPVALSPALERTVYRIQQEALTNVLKHAPGAAVRSVFRYEPHELILDIASGRGRPGDKDQTEEGGGHGLIGMRERVSLVGGQLEAGPVSGGGFRVRAVLPLERGP